MERFVDRTELENVIEEEGGAPVYERNQEIMLIHYKILIAIASILGVVVNSKWDQKEIKRLVGDTETLKGFLTKPTSDITGEVIRDALYEAGP